jgi:hypothetical protein
MPFRLWLYVNAIGMLMLVGAMVSAATGFHMAFGTCLGIAFHVGSMNALMVATRLSRSVTMLCPFCKSPGTYGADRKLGPYLECATCGLVHGTGPFWLWLTRDSGSDSGHHVDRSDP